MLAIQAAPILDAAVAALPIRPDVLLVDAGGLEHPERAGLALHLGTALAIPSVGVTRRPVLATAPSARTPAPLREARRLAREARARTSTRMT